LATVAAGRAQRQWAAGMMSVAMMICPFCGETDFDPIGLKGHLLMGWCDVFSAIETFGEERARLDEAEDRN
jgi:hypothetical protein